MKPTLLVLAAGMGSRYGGLKQMDPFGPNGETIIDYSIYDSIRAGFGKVVFIIRENLRNDFQELFDPKLKGKIEIEYVAQKLNDLPEPFILPDSRQKPWGTAHAVQAARNSIKEPFAVINADDYYGYDAYATLVEFFGKSDRDDYAVVAYRLKNTLSDFGDVNRGICVKDESDYLTKIVETLKISKLNQDGEGSYPDPNGEGSKILAPDTLVSMNMFGFQADFFTKTEEYFKEFLEKNIETEKSEFFIPLVLDRMIHDKYKKIKVLSSDAEWFGVTYQDDKPYVVGRIKKLIEDGIYPEKLW